MSLLQTQIVSRKTPGDGRIEISLDTATTLEARSGLLVRVGESVAPARVERLSCTCGGSSGQGDHLHHFLAAEPLRSLTPGTMIRLEMDEETGVLRVG
jgi:hypothetical protein